MSAPRDKAERSRLTDRQAAVLAAIERLGRPSMPELHGEFPQLAPSAVARVLESLERKGLVARAGDPDQIYLGGVRWWSTALPPDSLAPDVAAIVAALETAAPDLERSVDPAARTVTVYVPVAELEDFLAGGTSVAMQQVRGCVWLLEREGRRVDVGLDTRIVSGPEPRLAVKLSPALASPG